MKYLTQILKSAWLMPVVALMMLVSSCNKDLEQFPEPVPTGLKLGELLKNNPDYSFYYAMLNRGNLLSTINDSSKVYTMFVSDNAGVAKFLSAITGTPIPYPGVDDGVILGIINTQVTPEQAAGVVLYNTIPQLIKSSSISNAFPSFFYPSMINIDPRLPQDPFLKLIVFPSSINGLWFNNIPIVSADQMASNGVIHQTYTVSAPARRTLWDRINTDNELTYLKAAIQRADSGALQFDSLKNYLNSDPSPDNHTLTVFSPLTVFAPVDTAFESFVKNLLVASGVPGFVADGLIYFYGPTIISNPGSINVPFFPDLGPSLAAAITPQLVKGLVVYHVFGKKVFTNNFPTTETAYPTLLNTILTNHPGLKIKVTLAGSSPSLVVSATVKDAIPNKPAASIIMSGSQFIPDPVGSYDQNYVNGVLHKITSVLQPF